MSLVFIPLYIKFLGIEAYAVIGFFATLNSLFGFLDLGLSSTLNRELARSSVSEGDSQKPRNLLRTLESIYLLVALLIILIVGLSSQFIATDWLNTENLSVETVGKTVVLLGIAIGFQWPLGLYRGGLQGLQKHSRPSGPSRVAAAATAREEVIEVTSEDGHGHRTARRRVTHACTKGRSARVDLCRHAQILLARLRTLHPAPRRQIATRRALRRRLWRGGY